MPNSLNQFIQSNPDSREMKRAVAVEMAQQGYKHREIQSILGVSSGYISKWAQRYDQTGVLGLRLSYSGSEGHLDSAQRQEVIAWLQANDYLQLAQLQGYVHERYGVVFKSKQSYYTLLKQAGICWKKTQKHKPKTDPELVQKKEGIDNVVRHPSH